MEKKSYHNISYPSALSNRAVFGGVYTSDLIIIAMAAFVINDAMKGQRIELIYSVIGGICIPLYIFLLAKEKYFAKSYFFFKLRSFFKGRSLYMRFTRRDRE